MSKTTEKDRAKDDEDLDEDESTDEGNDDGEEEEAKATAIRGRGHAHDDDDDADDDGADPEDAYWWAPHAVLSALVLIGLLGFFGMFNKTPLARLAAPVAPEPDDHAHTAAAAPPAPAPTPRPAKSAQPPREMFGAKHLLVMYQGSRRAPATITRTKEEAKARATEAMTKAKADPSKFADIVKEYSDEPGADRRGGDLGKFPKGAMVPEFQAGLEKIKVGEVSDLVETPFGFHVILRTQ
ncbi:peptidylprolyl isomerase [Sorangium cellulosum]|uniref:peptidylprolyl isomerase n=1 Tax=Sorangium cellulosum TaxID=56 RepID=A0A150PE87_SORCE|nr:peptidylprolyl isomerase [Sorangium cellulosum]